MASNTVDFDFVLGDTWLTSVDVNSGEGASTSGNSGRYASTSALDLSNHVSSMIPDATLRKSKWAVNLFNTWHDEWHIRMDGQMKVFDKLEHMNASNLNYCLQYFIADVRKVDGKKYPPRTLKEIFAMLQHYCNNHLNHKWSFFNDTQFAEARRVLDAEMRLSAREGT